VSRRELVLDLVARLPRDEGDCPLIVDIGYGTGATAAAPGTFGRVIGVDFSPLTLERPSFEARRPRRYHRPGVPLPLKRAR
jgi:SAM-dependent methyltransferase